MEHDYSNDPLKGAYGLKWHERDSLSLTNEEWLTLIEAVQSGQISPKDYFKWLKECQDLQTMRRKG